MSLFNGPEQHTANPPETWTVARRGCQWALCTAADVELQRFPTNRAAEGARTTGFFAELYAKEKRWYAGESVPGWRPCSEVARPTS